jgi:hypothetical protein
MMLEPPWNDESDQTQRAKEEVFYDKIAGSKILSYHLQRYEGASRPHPDKTYQYLYTTIKQVIRTKNMNDNRKALTTSPSKPQPQKATPAAVDTQQKDDESTKLTRKQKALVNKQRDEEQKQEKALRKAAEEALSALPGNKGNGKGKKGKKGKNKSKNGSGANTPNQQGGHNTPKPWNNSRSGSPQRPYKPTAPEGAADQPCKLHAKGPALLVTGAGLVTQPQ